MYNDNIEVLKRPVLLSCCLIFEKQKWAIHRLSTAYPPDKHCFKICHLETTKVLKFPKTFAYLRKKQYLCTLFVIWHSTHQKTSTIYLHQGSGNEVVTEQLRDLQ